MKKTDLSKSEKSIIGKMIMDAEMHVKIENDEVTIIRFKPLETHLPTTEVIIRGNLVITANSSEGVNSFNIQNTGLFEKEVCEEPSANYLEYKLKSFTSQFERVELIHKHCIDHLEESIRELLDEEYDNEQCFEEIKSEILRHVSFENLDSFVYTIANNLPEQMYDFYFSEWASAFEHHVKSYTQEYLSVCHTLYCISLRYSEYLEIKEDLN